MLAESPTAVQAYAAINNTLEHSALTPVEQQVVTLTVSATNDCAYCMGAHSAVGQMVHMPEDVLTALREQKPLSDQKLNALRALVLSVLCHHGWVPEEDLEHVVAAGYTQRHVLDVLTRGAQDPEQLCESHRPYTARSAVCVARVERQGCHSRLTRGKSGWDHSTVPADPLRPIIGRLSSTTVS